MAPIKALSQEFSPLLLSWFDGHGRKNLPWQLPRSPYRVWISEIMLQQTQVQTVIPYFTRFISRFPTLTDLANASEDEVLSLWSGLGYYSRARNIHHTAKIINEHHQGNFPMTLERLEDLPGIGPSTAAAILSQAFNQPTAILDGNVKRVLTRFFRIQGWTEQAAVKRRLWELAQQCMPKERCADYTQAIMDLGALCCTNKKPNCLNCPLQQNCLAFKYQEQHLYPTKKIKKQVPTEEEQFLVLYNEQGLIFLEKRPPTGLWGGLWCLPRLNTNACPLEYIHDRYALLGEEPKSIMKFKHRFSHFHLAIDALKIKTKALKNRLSESQGQWFAQEELSSLGLAKPIHVILSRVYEEHL